MEEKTSIGKIRLITRKNTYYLKDNTYKTQNKYIFFIKIYFIK
jgi:hypothetical protein